MKKFFAMMFAVVAFATANAAQGTDGGVTEEYPIRSNYTAISATSMIEVVLLDAPKNSVRVVADERLLPYLQIVIDDGVLKFSYQQSREYERIIKRNRDIEDTRIYVSKRGVNTIVASGMSEFECDTPIDAKRFTIKASGMTSFDFDRIECDVFNLDISGKSEFEAKLNAQTATLTISGMSEVDINGRTNTLKLNVSGMSGALLEDFAAVQVQVNVSGMSEASVLATEQIKGGVSGMSKITSHGTANVVDVQSSGGSSHKHVRR